MTLLPRVTIEAMRRRLGLDTIPGHDGRPRAIVADHEGEFVCTACDTPMVRRAMPAACSACGHDRIETLTPIREKAPAHG